MMAVHPISSMQQAPSIEGCSTPDARLLQNGTYSAWLTKVKSDKAKAKWISSTTSRFFTIDFDAQIFYYSHAKGCKKIAKPILFSNILGAERMPAGEQRMGRRGQNCGFLVRTVGRTFELYTDTTSDAAQWTYALNGARELAVLREVRCSARPVKAFAKQARQPPPALAKQEQPQPEASADNEGGPFVDHRCAMLFTDTASSGLQGPQPFLDISVSAPVGAVCSEPLTEVFPSRSEPPPSPPTAALIGLDDLERFPWEPREYQLLDDDSDALLRTPSYKDTVPSCPVSATPSLVPEPAPVPAALPRCGSTEMQAWLLVGGANEQVCSCSPEFGSVDPLTLALAEAAGQVGATTCPTTLQASTARAATKKRSRRITCQDRKDRRMTAPATRAGDVFATGQEASVAPCPAPRLPQGQAAHLGQAASELGEALDEATAWCSTKGLPCDGLSPSH